jgi:putative NADH-flavin reductase
MKTILILGSTGKIGSLLTKKLLEKKYFVTALVRNPNKLTIQSSNLKIIQGDVSSSKDLGIALNNVDAVISVLGHGFRTPFPIQKRTMEVLIPVMEDKEIKRLITITGSDLLVEGDEYPLYAKLQRKIFSLVDPYRMADAVDQQKILEKSNLDWTVDKISH